MEILWLPKRYEAGYFFLVTAGRALHEESGHLRECPTVRGFQLSLFRSRTAKS